MKQSLDFEVRILDKTYELLQKIKKCPEIYLGRRSLELLHIFLCGYRYHEQECQGEYQPDCLNDFNQYMQEKHELCTDHNWASVIRFFSSSDEKAFETFYIEMEEFLEAKASGKFVAVKPWEIFMRPKKSKE